MKRALQLAAFVFIPGAMVAAAVVAVWRWAFQNDEERVSEATRLRIERDAEDADRARALEDQLVVAPPRPPAEDGPAQTSRYTEPVK